MGYIHYWTDGGEGERLSPQDVTLIKRVTSKAYHQGLIQREHDDPRPPLVTTREVRFNGIGQSAHEVFCFRTDPGEAIGRCKTARKPYDEVVMRVLLVLGYCREGLVIHSDSTFSDAWSEALAWFNDEVGYAFIEERIGFCRSAPRCSRLPDHSS